MECERRRHAASGIHTFGFHFAEFPRQSIHSHESVLDLGESTRNMRSWSRWSAFPCVVECPNETPVHSGTAAGARKARGADSLNTIDLIWMMLDTMHIGWFCCRYTRNVYVALLSALYHPYLLTIIWQRIRFFSSFAQVQVIVSVRFGAAIDVYWASQTHIERLAGEICLPVQKQ